MVGIQIDTHTWNLVPKITRGVYRIQATVRWYQLWPPTLQGATLKIIDLYLAKVPQSLRGKSGCLYLVPLPFTPTGSRPWFYEETLPLRRLQGLLKKMCVDAEVEGNFTNHSLRATVRVKKLHVRVQPLYLMLGFLSHSFRKEQGTGVSMPSVCTSG